MFTMALLQLAVYVSSIACLQAAEHGFVEWMKPDRIEEFKTAFNDLLDHNRDGHVNKTEVAIGILAQIDAHNIAQTAHEFMSFIPTHYSCIPSLDFVDFADCLTIQTRRELLSDITIDTQNDILSFEESLNSYFTFQPRGPNLRRSCTIAWKKATPKTILR